MLLPTLLAGILTVSQAAAGPVHPDLAGLTARWRQAMEACGVPALAVVLVEGDQIVHRVTLGRRDPARDAPVTPETIFYIASATKPFVALALAQLAAEGRVDLDAPVKRFLPRFRLADPVASEELTVRDLLCHRPGLQNGPIVLLDAYTGEITEDRYYHFLEEVGVRAEPLYSNIHFTLAGRIVEAASGEPWREYLARHVFAPCGMTRTTGYADWMYAQDDVAIPALVVDGRAQATPVRKTDRTMHAAGGLGTSIDDLARWIRLQLGHGALDGVRVLPEAAIEETWELQARVRDASDFGPTEGFGLGWQRGNYRGHLELRHGGGYVGAGSYVCFLPELRLGLGILVTGGAGAGGVMQLVSTDVHEVLLADDEVRDPLPGLLERARAAREREARPREEPAPEAVALALPLGAYAGTYVDPWLGTLVLEERGGRLAGHLGELALRATPRSPTEIELSSDGAVEGWRGVFELEAGVPTTLVLLDPRSARFVRQAR